MKKLFAFAFAGVLLASCSKNSNNDQTQSINNPANATNLGELTIPENFNWSSSIKGTLDVSLDIPSYMAVNGQQLLLVDDQMNVLSRSIISGEAAQFYFNIPQNNVKVSLYHPATQTLHEVTKAGSTTFKIEDVDLFALLDDAEQNQNKKGATAIVKNKAMADILVNGDFSVDDIGTNSNSIYSLRATGKWYTTDTQGSVNQVSGNNVYQSNSWSNLTCILQSVAITPGTAYTFNGIYGTTGGYTRSFALLFFDANGSYVGTTYPTTGSNVTSATGTAPNNAAYIQIYASLKRLTWIDNISLDVAPAIADDDNDGVSNDDDDYPNDPTRAYTSYFPTAGYQTVSFEDLWPAKGDFDLNDMVLTNNVVYTTNANNELVDATFTISLDAVGSGFSNGLAIVFTDASKQPLSQSIISSVTGNATSDPSVTNGLVVFNDVYLAQSDYYQNNGVGPDASADVFTFTVNFNANAGTQSIIPDVYIYRTSDRGLEVHLDGFSGTTAANTAYNNTIDDVSGTYSTSTGLPWVLEVVTPNKSYKHPLEKVDILVAYPQFQTWAETSGSQNTDWMDNPVSSNIYNN